MPRVLHLIETGSGFEHARTASTLERLIGPSVQIETRAIGRGGAYRSTAHAAASLRRDVAGFHFVHAFGARALSVAALGTPLAIAFSPEPDTRPATVRWLRAILGYRRVEAIAPTATLRRVLVEHGIPLEHCHLVRPGVDFSRIRRRRDADLRAALGFGETDYVILAAGETTRAAAHDDAAWASGILHVADPKYRLLLWGRGPAIGKILSLRERWPLPGLLTFAEQKLKRNFDYEDLLPAADAIVVTARGPVSTLPIAISMAAALPIVSTVTYTVSELLEDRHTALMAPVHKPRLLARRILDLQDDPGLQWSISDLARTEAYEYFSTTRMLEQYRALYEQMAKDRPVVVPEQAPGAGLRFHARA